MLKNTSIIVVTGGAGYLGSVLVPLLLSQGYHVRVIDRFFFGRQTLPAHSHLTCIEADIRRYPKKLLMGADALIDLAALTNDAFCQRHPALTMNINYRGRVRSARLAKSARVTRYILASSCSIYGGQKGVLTETSVPSPLRTYAQADVLAQQAIMDLQDKNFHVTVLRFGSLFGISPRMRFDLPVNKMVASLVKTSAINVTYGAQWRPLLHVADAAKAIVSILETQRSKTDGQIFNVAGDNVQIVSLAKRIAAAINIPHHIIMDANTYDDRSYRVSTKKIQKIVGVRFVKTVEEGAKEIYTALTHKAIALGPTTHTATWYNHLMLKNPTIFTQKSDIPEKRIIKKLPRCGICGNTQLKIYLDIGAIALANVYVTRKNKHKKDHTYPLAIAYCPVCHLSQLTHSIEPSVLFKKYAYFSSASPQVVAHFQTYADDLWTRFPHLAKKLVVDIASNDGVFLAPMKKHGSHILGIDPARNIAAAATGAGIATIPKFFTPTLAQTIKQKYGAASIVTASNVVAHTPYPHEFMDGVQKLLDTNGIFILQVKYLPDLIRDNAFDTVYHEHVSYFLLSPLITLLKTHGMDVFDVQRVDAEGGSLRVFAAISPLQFPVRASVTKLLDFEKTHGYYTFSVYKNYSKQPTLLKKQLVTMLRLLKKNGKRIAAYGASAKGGNLLQYCRLDTTIIDFVADTTPFKVGKYMPGTHIPIVDANHLKKNPPDYILLLAWNFADSIIKREAWFTASGGKFILPIPTPRVL